MLAYGQRTIKGIEPLPVSATPLDATVTDGTDTLPSGAAAVGHSPDATSEPSGRTEAPAATAFSPLAITHTVTFNYYDAQGNPATDIKTVDEGDSAAAPTADLRPGYRFMGWGKSFSNVTANLIVNAQYIELASFTVTANYTTVVFRYIAAHRYLLETERVWRPRYT